MAIKKYNDYGTLSSYSVGTGPQGFQGNQGTAGVLGG